MTVTVICDPNWDGTVDQLSALAPVWIVASAAHRRMFELLVALDRRDITLYDGGATAEGSCAEILSEVELHHGAWSARPACHSIRVIRALAAYDDGFEAVRND
jgi:hypothetical protein